MNELTYIEDDRQNNKITFTKQQTDMIKTSICKDFKDDEFNYFIAVCQARGLNPLLKEIHGTIHKDKFNRRTVTFITGIDGFRKCAHSTGTYAGRDKTVFLYNDKKIMIGCEVTVHRFIQGHKCSFTASAYVSEYKPSQASKGFMWAKMPHNMIEKCCEVKAIRMAFTQELGGIYGREEAHQMDDKVKNINTDSEIKDMNEIVEVAPVKKNQAPEKAIKQEPDSEGSSAVVDNQKATTDTLPKNEIIAKEDFREFLNKTRGRGWKDSQVQKLMFLLTGKQKSSELDLLGFGLIHKYIIEDKYSPESMDSE